MTMTGSRLAVLHTHAHHTPPTSVLAPGLSLRLLRLRKELEEEDWVLKAARQECPATPAADADDDAGCDLHMRRAAAPPAVLLLLPAVLVLLKTVESMAMCGWRWCGRGCGVSKVKQISSASGKMDKGGRGGEGRQGVMMRGGLGCLYYPPLQSNLTECALDKNRHLHSFVYTVHILR